MTRKKVEIKLINDESRRKTTFKKRKKGLMKKVNELSTLCGVDACAIIYSPYEPQPDVWPDNDGVQRVLAQFKRMPEMEQSKKMVNRDSFIRQRITKADDQLKKKIKENRDKEMTEVMYQCLTGKGSIENLNLPDLNELGGLVDLTMKDISKRIESLKKGVPPGNAAPPLSLPSRSQLSVGGSSSGTTNEMVARLLTTPPPSLLLRSNVSVGGSSSGTTNEMIMARGPSAPPPSLPPRSYVSVDGSSSSNTNEIMARGLTMRAMEKRPMVDNNPSAMNGMQRTTQWFTDLMNNQSEQNPGLGPAGYEMTTPFVDSPNLMWPNPYFR